MSAKWESFYTKPPVGDSYDKLEKIEHERVVLVEGIRANDNNNNNNGGGGGALSTAASGQHCRICLNEFSGGTDDQLVIRLTPCSHVFHPSCIVEWLDARNSCPLCRRRLR